MGQKKLGLAVEVLKLTVEAYPDSFNVYDSLAEAYMNRGDRVLAIKNYEKPLELNPKNFGAAVALAKLKAEEQRDGRSPQAGEKSGVVSSSTHSLLSTSPDLVLILMNDA